MKQKLLNKLWLRVWMIVAVMTTALAGTAQADTKTFDFKFETIGSTGWSNSYAAHQYEYTEGTVKFTAASKQTQTISTMPVTKGQPVEFVMKEGYTISAATFNCKQWGSKAQTITLHYSTDGGENYTSTDVTSSNFVITSSELPEGTNAVKITFNSTSNQVGIESLDLTYSTGGGGSSAVATTTTIDASGITNTDVYEGTEAGSLSATVADADNKAVEGASVTWSGNNDAVATIDEGGNVTLVAAGTVKFTAAYAGVTDEYFASSATYEMTVTDSTPFTGGDVTFAAAIDLGTSPLTKNGVIFECSNGALNNGSEYRLYKNSETTFSLSDDIIASGYLIKSIAFTCTSTNPASGFTAQEGWVTDGNNGTWTGAATSVSFTASNAQVRATEIVVTVGQAAALSSITLSGDYPTTFHVGDTFSHEGIVVTATYEDATTKDVTASAEFTGYDMANAGAQTVTVSYTEGELTKTATYGITVNAPATLLSITLSGTYPTEFGQGDTFSSEGIVVTANFDDNTTANVTAEATFTGYDMSVLGEQTVTVSYEGQEATYTITIVEKKGTATNPYTVAEARAAIDAGTGVTGVYATGIVSQAGTVNNSGQISYYISADGLTTSDQLQAYKGKGIDGADFESDDDIQVGDVVVIYGDLKKYNSIYEFDANNQLVSLVRPVNTDPTIAVSPASVNATAAETEGAVAITYENLTISAANDFEVQFYDGEGNELQDAPDWIDAEVEANGESYAVSYVLVANDGEARTAYFKVYAMDDETNLVYSNLVTVNQAAYVAPATGDQYALFTGNLVEGDYIIYYNGKAMNTDVQNDRLMYAEVTPENDVITTSNAAIVWHIAKSGDYWTIYNAEADAYAASTGVKNKAQMLADGTDDMALWTVSDEYEFVNKKNSEAGVNANLRNNGTYGFACYAATTGGELSLYKKVGDAPVPTSQTVTVSAAGYATLVAAQDLEIPANVKVYAVQINGEWAILNAIENGIPAGEAVVVKADAGEYVFNYATDAVESLTVTNDLVAATAPVTADGSQYVLAKLDEEIGFYKATVGSTIAAGKAYLQIAGEATVKGFTFKFGDDATSINEELRVKSEESSIYNLAGQRVSKMQRGINIVNGKKLLK